MTAQRPLHGGYPGTPTLRVNRAALWRAEIEAPTLADHVAAAVDALEWAKTGLQWYRDEHPEDVDGSDDETDAAIDAALSGLRSIAPAQPLGYVNLRSVQGLGPEDTAAIAKTPSQWRNTPIYAAPTIPESDPPIQRPHAWSCSREAKGHGRCVAWCGVESSCISSQSPAAPTPAEPVQTEAGEPFKGWIASNWPTLATPEWFESDDGQQQLDAFRAGMRFALSTPPTPATEYCWLVELRSVVLTGGPYYHTGFTGLHGQSRSTKDPLKAKRYPTKEAAQLAAFKLDHIAGTWEAIEHGFMSGTQWKMAPVEPTPEMMRAYEVAFASNERFDGAKVYKAMLAAAPSGQQAEPAQAHAVIGIIK